VTPNWRAASSTARAEAYPPSGYCRPGARSRPASAATAGRVISASVTDAGVVATAVTRSGATSWPQRPPAAGAAGQPQAGGSSQVPERCSLQPSQVRSFLAPQRASPSYGEEILLSAGGIPSPPSPGSRLLITSRPSWLTERVKLWTSTVRSTCTAGTWRSHGGAASSSHAATSAYPSRAYPTASRSRSAWPGDIRRQVLIRAP